MKVICQGDSVYRIFDDTTQVYNLLPRQTYVIRFSKMTGFYLMRTNDLEINEKIYGVHEAKVKKVVRSYNLFDRSLGVILSGDKGIGKTVFAKMLAREIELPVILVDTYYEGIAGYINEIECEAMILFDEFEKRFIEDEERCNQTELLSLFDGTSAGKKLYIITCNSVNDLNQYLLNRPGRFHYHFTFEYPTADEIREYLTDKVKPEYQPEIDSVIEFAAMIDINYDSLRAIAFELNTGSTFKEALNDLNIINQDNFEYLFYVEYENGIVIQGNDWVDLFDNDESNVTTERVELYTKDFQRVGTINLKRGFGRKVNGRYIEVADDGYNVELFDESHYNKPPQELLAISNSKPKRVYLKRNRINTVRYAV